MFQLVFAGPDPGVRRLAQVKGTLLATGVPAGVVVGSGRLRGSQCSVPTI